MSQRVTVIRRVRSWAKGFGYMRLVLIAIAALFILWAAYTVVYRLFFAGRDVKKAEATAVVAKAQGKAEEVITTETLHTMQESQVVKADVATKVTRARGKVDGESRRPNNAAGMHNAGLAALCELHDDFCGDAGPAAVQQVH